MSPHEPHDLYAVELHEPATGRPLVSRHIARLMDDLVTIPGTRQGVGADALLGLLPGVGDLLGSSLSAAVLFDAVRMRVPVPVLAMMAWNLVLDAVLGLVPIGGDLLDIAHRANRKNYRLLLKAVERDPSPRPPTPGYLAAALALTVLPLLFSIAAGVLVLVLLWRWLT